MSDRTVSTPDDLGAALLVTVTLLVVFVSVTGGLAQMHGRQPRLGPLFRDADPSRTAMKGPYWLFWLAFLAMMAIATQLVALIAVVVLAPAMDRLLMAIEIALAAAWVRHLSGLKPAGREHNGS